MTQYKLSPAVSLLLSVILLSSCAGGNSSATTLASTATTATAISSTTTTTTTGACVPVTQSIPFSGSGLAIDSEGDLYGGLIPSTGTYGSITVGTSSTVSGTTYSNTAESTVGSIQISITAASGTATVAGTLAIGSTYQEQIENFAVSDGLATSASAACISGLALEGRLSSTSGYGYVGYVFLYLNQSSHGYVLTF